MIDNNIIETRIAFHQRSCAQCVDIIFDNLVKMDLLDPKSEFFAESKNRIFHGYFQSFYPFAEFFIHLPTKSREFFIYNSSLFVAMFFLDQALDSLSNTPSTKVRSFQISSYLFLNYIERLMLKEDSQNIMPIFYNYYREQTEYLVLEKKWTYPKLYISKYCNTDRIHKKGILLLFPFELLSRKIPNEIPDLALIKDMFINYFSFITLADDILDLDDDIRNKCITYPIALHYKQTGKFLEIHEQPKRMLSDVTAVLSSFQQNLQNLEREVGKNSLIMNNSLSHLRTGLRKVGIRL